MEIFVECTTPQASLPAVGGGFQTGWLECNPVLELPFVVPDVPFNVEILAPSALTTVAGAKLGLAVVSNDQPAVQLVRAVRRLANANDDETLIGKNFLTAAKLGVNVGATVPLRVRHKTFLSAAQAKFDANAVASIVLHVWYLP